MGFLRTGPACFQGPKGIQGLRGPGTCEHKFTYSHTHTSCTTARGFGWRIHCDATSSEANTKQVRGACGAEAGAEHPHTLRTACNLAPLSFCPRPVLPRRLWRVVGWVGILLDMIGGVESALWEGVTPHRHLRWGLCDSLCLVLLCGGRYCLGGGVSACVIYNRVILGYLTMVQPLVSKP